ncbi:MAG: hypothetical protein GX442_11525 [Candidatus Riflebacteria bacterium]|nr:hypothetical protein [Candidatus Riflebacteria bacterium]
MSTSKNNPSSHRLLLFFDQGLASTLASDLLLLLSQAGFDLRCRLAPGAERWLPAEPIRCLTGHQPVTGGPLPGWNAATGGGPVLGIAVVPDGTALALAGGAPGVGFAAPGAGGEGSEAGESFPWLVVTPGRATTGWAAGAAGRRVMGVMGLGDHPGGWAARYEELFARVMRFLRHRQLAAGRPVAVQHLVPEALAGVSDQPPGWVDDLRRHLAWLGFPATVGPERGVALRFLTYGGPFPAPGRATGRRLAFSFQAAQVPPPPAGGLAVQFLTPATPAEEAQALASPGRLPVLRDGQGNLTVFEAAGPRLFPDLTDHPALLRLVEHLSEKPLTSA